MEIACALQTETGVDGDLAIQCALLHDTIEDTAATFDDIKENFGEKVAAGVLALSKDASIEGKQEKMQDSLRRIKLQPREIWMVKMADRITNLYHPPFYWDNAKILSYCNEARSIHAELHAASSVLANRLLMMIDRYPQFVR